MQELRRSIVGILSSPKGNIEGTGFIVSDGHILTCAHTIQDYYQPGCIIYFQLEGSQTVREAQVIRFSPKEEEDIALLRPSPPLEDPTALPLSESTGRQDHAFSIYGYPKAGSFIGLNGGGQIMGHTKDEQGRTALQLDSRQITHGFSGAPVWDEKAQVVVGMLSRGIGDDEIGRPSFAIPSETIWQLCPEIRPSPISPYVGLETFTEETAQFFFGREALTEKLTGVLRGGCRFLAVFGPSGSGKSSVVRAGLLPALKKGGLPGSQKWAQVTMRPGEDPFAQMQAAGRNSFDIQPGEERVILFIDQFEEFFSLCPDDLREKFIGELTAALENSRFLLVICMRNDFYSAFQDKAGQLARSDQLKIENVPGTLQPGELIAMIERPARAVGLGLETGLTERIIKDLAREGEVRSSSLPLLEFALMQLWEKPRDGPLTHEAYKSIGGVTGSLARWADDAYSDLLPKAKRPLAENLLTSLVHLGDEAQGLPDTRRRRNLTEFDEATRGVIKHFADRRLLVTGDEKVELVHDALVREWGRLQDWLRKNRAQLRLLEDVGEAASAWRAAPSNPDLLVHRGGRLEDALRLGERLGPQEAAYLAACRAAQQRSRRRLITGVTLAVLAIIVVLSGWLLTSNRNAVKLSHQVQVALARQLAAQAQSIFASGDSRQRTSVLLAVQSMRLYPIAEAAIILQTNSLGLPVARMTHDDVVLSAGFSPDGKYVVSGSWDHTARVWEATTGQEIARMTHDDTVGSVAFSPDGKYVVSGSDDGTARVWEAATGQEIARMTHDGDVYSVAFSPDGKYVVSGSGDGTARVWEAATGQEIARMTHASGVSSVAFSPDGKYVVSGSDDGAARVWEVATGQEIARMTHASGVSSAAFSPDGKYVVSGSKDNTARVWDATSGREIARMTHATGVYSVAFSPDGKYVVSGGDYTARVWDATTGQEIARMTHATGVYSVAFSPDEKYVLSGSADGTARVWEATSGKEIARMTHDRYVNSVAFSPDGKYVVSGSGDGTARVWEVAMGQEIARMTHETWVYSVAFSPDGKYVVSGGYDGTARVWEATTGQEVARMTHDDPVNSVAFSPDGRYVVSGSADNTARVWDATTGQEIARMIHDRYVYSVAFSPDGKYVVSGSYDNTARVWAATTGHEIARMTHDDGVASAAFSPDGRYVVSGSGDRTARVWEATTGQEIARMTHASGVNSVAFSPDEKYVVSGSKDNTARVWDATSGREIARMTHASSVGSAAFSPDGKYVVSGGDYAARVWLWQTSDLIETACARLDRNLTRAEWKQYIGDALPYQAVCPDLPVEP